MGAAAKAAFRRAGGVTTPASVGAAAGGLLVTLSNGAKVPADTPAIAAAKAAFRAAGGEINPAAVGQVGAAAAGLLVTLSNGAVVPADTPAIAAAKAAFRKAGGVTDPAASVGAAAAGLVSSLTNAPYSGPVAAPGPLVTHSNGAVTPADTPAIAAAKAKFRAAGGVTNPSAVGALLLPFW